MLLINFNFEHFNVEPRLFKVEVFKVEEALEPQKHRTMSGSVVDMKTMTGHLVQNVSDRFLMELLLVNAGMKFVTYLNLLPLNRSEEINDAKALLLGEQGEKLSFDKQVHALVKAMFTGTRMKVWSQRYVNTNMARVNIVAFHEKKIHQSSKILRPNRPTS